MSDLTKEKSATVFVDGDRGGELIIKELMHKADIDFVTAAPRGKEVEELTQKEVFKALRDKIPIEAYKKEGFAGSKITNSDEAEPKPASEPKPEYEERPGHRYPDERRGRYERRDRTDRRPPRDSGLFKKMGFGRREEEKPARVTPKQKEEFARILDDLVGTRAACVLDEKGNVLGRVPLSEIENTIKSMESPYAILFDGVVTGSMVYTAKNKGVKCLVGMEKEAGAGSGICVMDRKDLVK